MSTPKRSELKIGQRVRVKVGNAHAGYSKDQIGYVHDHRPGVNLYGVVFESQSAGRVFDFIRRELEIVS